MVIMARDTEIKAGYKQTEVGVIPEDWDVKNLGKLGRVIRGASPRPQGDKRYYGGNIPRLMVEDVTRDGKYVIPSVDFLTEEGAKRSRPCKKGTLTIVCSGTVGIPSFLSVDACIHDGFLALVNINKHVSDDYLYHQLMMLKDRFEISATHGGVFTNLTTSILIDFQISLPPLPEQRAIANALSDVDVLITSLDKLIAKKRDIKQATKQQLLTGKTRLPGFRGEWIMKRLGDIIEFKSGKPYEDFVRDNGEYFLITSDSISIDGKLKKEHKRIIFFDDSLSKDDIVIILDDIAHGNLLGLCDLIPEDNKYVLNQRIGRLRTDANTNSKFLSLLINCHQDHFKKRGQGTSQMHIYKRDIDELLILIPLVEEQHAIATVLSDMDEEITALEQKRDKTRALKQGMMQELLTGKTRLL